MKSIRRWWRKSSGWALAGMFVLVALVLGVFVTLAAVFVPSIAAALGSAPSDAPLTRPRPREGRDAWFTWDTLSGAYKDATTQEQRNALGNWWAGLWS